MKVVPRALEHCKVIFPGKGKALCSQDTDLGDNTAIHISLNVISKCLAQLFFPYLGSCLESPIVFRPPDGVKSHCESQVEVRAEILSTYGQESRHLDQRDDSAQLL